MVMLSVQSLLLILAAFIAGAMIACFLRRVFFVRDNEHPTPSGGRGSDERQEETVTTTTTKKTETRTVSATEASRFGRALTGAAGVPASATVLSSNDNENMGEAPSVPEAPTSSGDIEHEVHAARDVEAQTPAPSPSSEDVTPPATDEVAPDTGGTGAETGVSTSAGPTEPVEAAGEAHQTSAASAPSTSAPLSGAGDVAMLRSVRSEALVGSEAAVSDDNVFRLPAAGGTDVDDLKRIRGIGVLIEKKLNAMGVRTYEQIANWTAGDISRVSETLDFKGRIERESWIEQARILSSGGYTEFSRRG